MLTPRSLARHGNHRRGMTLVEAVVVLSMIGLMSAIAVPSLVTWRRDLMLEQAAQKVSAELNLAQVEAIRRNQPLSFYRLGDNTYRTATMPKRRLPGTVMFGSSSDSVRFLPFGPPSTGAAEFTLHLDGRTRVVTVSLGGHVSTR